MSAETKKPSVFLGMDPMTSVIWFIILGFILTGPAKDELKFIIIGAIITYFVVKGANAGGASGGSHGGGHH